MNIEWLIVSLYVFSAVFLVGFLFGIARLFTLSWVWPLKAFRSALFLVIGLLCLLVANQLSKFFPVFPNEPIANIYITKVHDKEYLLYLDAPGINNTSNTDSKIDKAERFFHLTGDLWQLDLRILSWQPVLAEFGAQPLYKFERLTARYHSIEDEQRLPRSLFELEDSSFMNRYWQQLVAVLSGSLINSYYGSAVYAPMADSAEYGVFLSPSGTELKPLNKSAEQALFNW